ncbi:InlB B-repeat-containing protein [Bifidobacterium pseudolongum]|uniref:InlB B-repeat-containing protein n=1 Tax=Bifidobacterium pseudolongum TaxID=1694 RepID=UPI00101F2B9B|nr:InlB B-repeat-containing protein [Bifidobacterium pseudolongum]RYQ12463.1 internalin [Bifidobacterium pseudolongum subsp. globosum]
MNTTTRPRAARRAIGAALASALMMIPCTTVIAAETDVPLDAAHFPDEAFRSVVQQYDTNNNGTLSQQELTAVTTINVGGRGIKSAKGIEYFTALTYLELGDNQLSSLDVSHNTALTDLYLAGNQLSSLDVSHNTALGGLGLDGNQLSSVDLSHNTKLEWLCLSNNQLSSVDVSHNTALEWLGLDGNQLSSVDLSHNTKLTELYLDGNQLSSMDLSHNTKLDWLNLSDNQLSSVDLSHNTALTVLVLDGNQLSSVDLSHNTALTVLYLDDNQLSSMDLSHNTALVSLYLNGNQLSSMDLSHNTALTYLELTDNQLSSVDLSRNTALVSLWLYDNQLSSVVLSHNTALTSLDLRHNQLSSVDVSRNTALTDLYLNGNQLSSVDVSHNTALEWLGLSGNRLLWVGGVANSINPDLSDQREFGPVAASSLDLAKAAPGIDVSRISNVQGGKLQGTVLTPTNAGGLVTYDYRFSDAYEPLHAQVRFDAPSFTVAFDTNGGSGNTVVSVVSGKTVTAPAAPTREGYTFAGWYTAKNGGSKYDFAKPVTTDLTLYARWTINKYTVTFDANGGSVVPAATVEHGQKATEPAAPTRTGYTFNGWYTAKTGGTRYDFTKPVTANTTLYAQWTIDKHTVKFDSNGGSAVASATVDYGKPVAQPAAPTRTGYAFDGWYTAKDGGSKYDFSKPVTGNLTLYAHWTANTPAKITFRDVSGSTPHADDIQWLADNGISTGWKTADGKYEFRGMSPVVRQDMAAFLRREAVKRNIGDSKTWKPTDADWKTFKDVNRSTPHAEDILWLAHAGISTGWKEADGSSTFRGMSPVVRQDMAAFLRRLAKLGRKDGGVTPKTDFTDVTDHTPHADDVRWLGGSGISTGYRNNDGSWRFEGMTSVYRQDMAAFIHRLDNQLNK